VQGPRKGLVARRERWHVAFCLPVSRRVHRRGHHARLHIRTENFDQFVKQAPSLEELPDQSKAWRGQSPHSCHEQCRKTIKDCTSLHGPLLLKLALNQMAMTCSDVTKIDVSDVQQMSQMADLNGSESVSMSPPSPPSSRSLVSVI
jgi:hypothetical protein